VKRTIRVHIAHEAKLVGTLHYAQQGARKSAMFEYDPTWLADPAHFALEPSLPLVAGSQFHRKTRDGSVFHAVIADTEPDGWGRRVTQRDHAKRRQGTRRDGGTAASPPLNALDLGLASNVADMDR